jgi:hypothetical protein
MMSFLKFLIISLVFINSFNGEEVEENLSQNFYVSETGKDDGDCTGDGSEVEPCRTIWYAYKQSSFDDRLIIGPGRYFSIKKIVIRHSVSLLGIVDRENIIVGPGPKLVPYLFSLKSDIHFFVSSLTLVFGENVTTIVIGEEAEKITVIIEHVLFVSNSSSSLFSGGFISGIGPTNKCTLYECDVVQVVSLKYFILMCNIYLF